MARTASVQTKIGFTAAAWFIALLLFAPILWTILTAFKTEAEAIASSPTFFPRDFTLDNFAAVQDRSDYFKHAFNSIVVSVGSTLLGLVIGVPAAWAMAFAPTKRTKDVLMWMLSTKMMPAVGVLIPIYLIFRDLRLLDTVHGLTIIMTLINLPIIIWMLYTYFKEIPVDILEAFWTITLTSGRAGTLTAFISSFSSPQGLFLAKLSAASLLAIAPILLMGWFSQKQLVRGLTFGAVK